MPSFCVIDTCKRVKQIGETVTSFHKFPLHNKDVYNKWIDFVRKTSKNKSIDKRISKFSSICSQHFQDSDFCGSVGNGNSNTPTAARRFLKKDAIPSLIGIIHNTEFGPITQEDISNSMEIIIDEPTNYEMCGLCRRESQFLNIIDDQNFSIMRKCLPFINFNLSFMQKICCECIEILSNFSNFIDRVIIAQNMPFEPIIHRNVIESQRGIKLEPLAIEDEQKIPFIRPINFDKQQLVKPLLSRPITTQKKCEILEIVDIKPFNFLPYEPNALNGEVNESNNLQMHNEQQQQQQQSYVEDEIQILSPKQLKVEINDPDEEHGQNEMEMIKNYVYISTVFLHDHNYVKENNYHDVKTEFDENLLTPSVCSIQENENEFLKVCCKKKFKLLRQYLIHKFVKHQGKNLPRNYCPTCMKIFPTRNSFHFHRQYLCKKNPRQMNVIKKKYQEMIKELKRKQLKMKVIRRRRKSSTYACKICNKSFKGPKNLYQHKFSHQESQNRCEICGKLFKRKHGLKQHIIAQHEKRKLYSCVICKHKYSLKGDLKRCRHRDLRAKH